jgi:hypothetical protein
MFKNLLIVLGLASTAIILHNCMEHPECTPWDPRCSCEDMACGDYASE